MTRYGSLLAALLAAAACGGAGPSAFEVRAAAAERAYVHGRYEEAATRWSHAAKAARTTRDRDEARYRRAVSLERGRRTDAAIEAYRAIAAARSSRSARALLHLALLAESRGRDEAFRGYLDRLVDTHPDTAAAERAVVLRLGTFDAQDEIGRYLTGLWRRLRGQPLGERAGYELAKWLERRGELERARDQFAAVAAEYPYPHGALWDDAIVHAAELDRQLGEPGRAVARLDEMLSHRERASLVGSYERPRYAEARFRIGELLRDDLDRPAAARRAFRKVWTEHTTSRLRDDALWEAAISAKRAHDPAGACHDARQLAREMPESRYATCGHLVCPEIAPGACRGYIQSEVTGE